MFKGSNMTKESTKWVVSFLVVVCCTFVSCQKPDQMLFKAAENGSSADILAAINKGADVNARDAGGYTALIYAAMYNEDPDVVKTLIDVGSDLNAKDTYNATGEGATALIHAAWKNKNPYVTKALLDAGADIYEEDGDGHSAFMKAAAFNTNPAVVEALIAAGADVSEEDKRGYTALAHAAESNTNPDVIRVLVGAGANVNARDGEGKAEVIQAEGNEKNEHEGLDMSLLESIFPTDPRGEEKTILMHAAEKNRNPAVLKALIDAGADVNTQIAGDMTALMFATHNYYNMAGVIKVLTDAGADVNAMAGGLTPLEYIDRRGGSDPDAMLTLIYAGANVDVMYTDLPVAYGKTMLMWNIEHNQEPYVIEAIIASSSDVNVKGLGNATALMYAAEYSSNLSVVKTLLAAGADVWARDDDGMTALMYAAAFNTDPDVIKTLAAVGADVNAQDDLGQTALMYAAANNENADVLYSLLAAGADVEAHDNDGNKAADHLESREDKIFRYTSAYRKMKKLLQ